MVVRLGFVIKALDAEGSTSWEFSCCIPVDAPVSTRLLISFKPVEKTRDDDGGTVEEAATSTPRVTLSSGPCGRPEWWEDWHWMGLDDNKAIDFTAFTGSAVG
jgi:hypothetical protein